MRQQTILGIECSSELCSVALQHDNILTFKSELAPREHAYLVLPFAKELLAERSLQFSDLQGIAFGQGPGAFTGLRVAASMAQGLALAHNVPLYAACSLNVLARQVKATEIPLKIISVLDARMSELYWAVFEKNEANELIEVQSAHLASPQSLMEALSILNLASPALFIGPGCRHLSTFLNKDNCLNYLALERSINKFPHARELLFSVNNQAVNGDLTQDNFPLPVYIRDNVAAKSKKTLV